MSMFSDLVEEAMKIFMDDFSIYGSSFEHCLKNLDTVLQRCQDKNLALNWEKCHFMVTVSKFFILNCQAKVSVIETLMPPNLV